MRERLAGPRSSDCPTWASGPAVPGPGHLAQARHPLSKPEGPFRPPAHTHSAVRQSCPLDGPWDHRVAPRQGSCWVAARLALSHRDLPLCDVLQLHGGRRVHWPGHPAPEHRRGLRRGQGLHHTRGHRRLPHRADQRESAAPKDSHGQLVEGRGRPQRRC